MSTNSGGNKMVTSSHDQHHSPLALRSHQVRQSTLPSAYPNHRLMESKSMSTLEARPAILSFPSQLKLAEKNLHKEVSRFCSQQLAPSNFLPNKFTLPLAIWTKSKSDLVRTNVVTFLNHYKGAEWRHQQLQYQMPIHDIELFRQPTAESKFIRNKQRKALVKSELFLPQQSTETCPKCKQLIQSGIHAVKITLSDHNAAIKSPKNGSAGQVSPPTQYHDYYHIDCFTCFECYQILVDLKAFVNVTSDQNNVVNYNLFCCRHFVEIYKPRCPYCDKLIFDEECTEAEGKAWHIGHFCCTECKRSLGGQQYIMASIGNKHDNAETINAKLKNKQIPYCLTCFDIMFGELCEECGELIGCEVGAIMHEGRSWHASDSCFRCSLCLKSLLGKPFLPAMDGRIYCSLTCSQAMISHQKERLRRQTKLQTLHSHRNSTPIKPENKIVNQANHAEQSHTENSSFNLNQQLTPDIATKLIKENRDNFMKSMTLGRYEKQTKQNNRILANNNNNSNNDYQKIKSLNLTQIVNYEEFIKQNNQCFTSKYDWSKEQEFLNVIDSSNEVLSQTTVSDQNSEDHNLMQQFLAKCDITASSHSNREASQLSQHHMTSNCVKPPLINNYNFSKDLQIKNVQKDQTTSMINPFVVSQSPSSSQNAANKMQLIANDAQLDNSINSNDSSSNYYFDEKSSSLNSPSSSNETPLWTTSPPPEYSKIEKDESCSSLSSIQTIPNSNFGPKNINKTTNGILKVNTKRTSEMKPVIELSQNPSSELNDSKPIASNFESIDSANYQPVYNPFMPINQNTVTNSPKIKSINNGHDTISKAKSVSFDPNIEDRNENKLRSIRKIRSVEVSHEDCSDSHSCSSCSTCSSSSSDDDDFDYNLANFNLNNQQARSHSSSYNEHQTNQRSVVNSNTSANNEACTIS